MNSFENNYDALESLIYEEGLRIDTIDSHPQLDLFLVVLNTSVILRQKISNYQTLKTASLSQLRNFELTGNGTGIHWPEIDEDLSLKGFLRDELLSVVGKPKAAAA